MNNIKQQDEIYCPECGKSIKRNAVIADDIGMTEQILKLRLEIYKSKQRRENGNL